MCRVEEAEPWTVWARTKPVARKEHICCECGRTIRAGEPYNRGTGLFDARWSSFAWCRHCEAAGVWMQRTCGGYLAEGLLEELDEHWYEDTAFRSVWLARAIAGMRRMWCGGRMSVPGEPPVLEVSA